MSFRFRHALQNIQCSFVAHNLPTELIVVVSIQWQGHPMMWSQVKNTPTFIFSKHRYKILAIRVHNRLDGSGLTSWRHTWFVQKCWIVRDIHIYQHHKSHQTYQDTRIPGYHNTRLQYIRLPGYQATRLPGYPATRLPGYQATRLSGYQATMLPGYQAVRLPGHQASRLPGYQTTRL